MLDSQPRRAHVVTVSDRSSVGTREDASGPLACRSLEASGWAVTSSVIPDGEESVAEALRAAMTSGVRVVVTSGGTGVGPRDQTPEGTRRVLDREIPGIPELLRAAAGEPRAYLSRGIAGVSGRTVVVNLPGSPKAVAESMAVLTPLLGHLVDQLDGEDH